MWFSNAVTDSPQVWERVFASDHSGVSNLISLVLGLVIIQAVFLIVVKVRRGK